jgi:hypothetical protein
VSEEEKQGEKVIKGAACLSAEVNAEEEGFADLSMRLAPESVISSY